MFRALKTIAVILVLSSAASAQSSPEAIRSAAGKSLALLRSSANEYTVQRKCFSCHHQPLAVLTMTMAKSRGFEVDNKEIDQQLQFTAAHLAKNRERYVQGKGQGGQAETAGYGLLTLHAGGWQADATTAAVVEYLLLRDQDRDFWQASTTNRPPTQTSAFATTYLALAALKNFGPPAQQEQIESRFARVRNWLVTAERNDTEDRVFHLRAMKLAGVEGDHVQAAGKKLADQQRNDGGWGQLDKLGSDAYATGSALVALQDSGVISTKNDVYQRGIGFLLKTQNDDGSWHVKTRAKPFQTYFESGFPHDEDQFISYVASGWATMAMLLTLDTTDK